MWPYHVRPYIKRPDDLRSDVSRSDHMRADVAWADNVWADHVRPHHGQPNGQSHVCLPDAESDHVRPDDLWPDVTGPHNVWSNIMWPYHVRPYIKRPDDLRSDIARTNHMWADIAGADNMRADHVRPHHGQPNGQPYVGCPNAEPDHVRPDDLWPDVTGPHNVWSNIMWPHHVRSYIKRRSESDHLQSDDSQSDEESDHVRANVVRANDVRADDGRADDGRADDWRANHSGADYMRTDDGRTDNVWTNYPGPDNLWAHHLRPNHVWAHHVRAHHVRPNHVRTNHVRADHVRANNSRSNHMLPDNVGADAARLLEPPRVGARQRASRHVRGEHAAPGPVPLRMQARVLPVVRLSDDPVLHRAVDHRPVDVRARGESRRAGRLSVAARRVHKSRASRLSRARARRVQRHAPHRGLSSQRGGPWPELDTAHPRDGQVRRIQGGRKHRDGGGHDHTDILDRGARRGSSDFSRDYANCDRPWCRLARFPRFSLRASVQTIYRWISSSAWPRTVPAWPHGLPCSDILDDATLSLLGSGPRCTWTSNTAMLITTLADGLFLLGIRDWDPRGPAQVRGRLVSLC